MDGKYRLTAIAVVLHGEIEDALRALGGQSKGTRINISALTRECRNWLMPELQTKLAKIRALRSKVYHNGSHSRRLFEQDQPLFSNECVDELQTIHTQLLEAKERQTGYAAALEELCTQFPRRHYWRSPQYASLTRALDAMERSPHLQHVQEAGVAALLSVANLGYNSNWKDYDEAARVTRIFEMVLRAMALFVSTSKVQRDGSAVLAHFTNPYLVQPLAQAAPDQIRERSVMTIQRLLSAVEAARKAHPDDPCVEQNCRDIMHSHLEWCRFASGDSHCDVRLLARSIKTHDKRQANYPYSRFGPFYCPVCACVKYGPVFTHA